MSVKRLMLFYLHIDFLYTILSFRNCTWSAWHASTSTSTSTQYNKTGRV